MTKSQLLATFVVGLLAIVFVASNIPAQNPAPVKPLGGQPVYLLDINYLFKNHPRLRAMKAEMKADVDREEVNVRKEKEAIKSLQETLRGYRPGTQDYRSMEQEIAKRVADLNVVIALQRKDFLQQEARIYYIIYKEILDEVTYFARQNRAALVLKFDREPIDVDMPQTVVRKINNTIIWSNQGLDITDHVLDQLARRIGNPQVGHQRPPGVPRGPAKQY